MIENRREQLAKVGKFFPLAPGDATTGISSDKLLTASQGALALTGYVPAFLVAATTVTQPRTRSRCTRENLTGRRAKKILGDDHVAPRRDRLLASGRRRGATDHEVRVDLRLHLARDKEDETLRPPLSRGTAPAPRGRCHCSGGDRAAADRLDGGSRPVLPYVARGSQSDRQRAARVGFRDRHPRAGDDDLAQERYHLVGAMPNMTYTVALKIYVGDPSCTNLTRTRQTATFDTNGVGNATADFTFFVRRRVRRRLIRSRAAIPVISSGGVPQYQTACVPVTLGA